MPVDKEEASDDPNNSTSHPRRDWKFSWADKLFMLLDYDSTNEAGVAENPSIFAAIYQSIARLFCTHGIEAFGFVFIVGVGAFCYWLISSS